MRKLNEGARFVLTVYKHLSVKVYGLQIVIKWECEVYFGRSSTSYSWSRFIY